LAEDKGEREQVEGGKEGERKGIKREEGWEREVGEMATEEGRKWERGIERGGRERG